MRPRDIDSEGPERTEVPVSGPMAQLPSPSDRTATSGQNEPAVAAHISSQFPDVMKSTKQDIAEPVDDPTQKCSNQA